MRLRTLLGLAGLMLVVLPSVGCTGSGDVSQDDIKKNAADLNKAMEKDKAKEGDVGGNRN